MPVFRFSRYDGSSFVGLRFDDGNVKRFVQSQTPINVDDVFEDWVEHEVQAGEELDQLAFEYGGDERLWWMIAEVNGLSWPWDIQGGTRLIIPVEALRRKSRR